MAVRVVLGKFGDGEEEKEEFSLRLQSHERAEGTFAEPEKMKRSDCLSAKTRKISVSYDYCHLRTQ